MSDPTIEEKRKTALRESWRRYAAKNREKRNAAGRERARKKYAENPEEAKAKVRAWQKAHSESCKRRKRKYYEANREKHNEWERNRYARNPGLKNKRNKEWDKANPEHLRARRHNRRARAECADGFHTADDIKRIMKQQRGRCAYCRKSIRKRRHLDHITPISKGGSNWPRNLQFTCPSCNFQKNNCDPIDFARRMGLLI